MTTPENEGPTPDAAAATTGGEVVPTGRTGEVTPATAGEVAPLEADELAAPTALLAPAPDPRAEAWRTRVLLPLLLPLVSAGAVFVYVINLSRSLLAPKGDWGSLVIASIITVMILGGAAWISAHPRIRTSTLVIVLAGFFVLVGAMGTTSLGPSEEKGGEKAAGYQEPKGEPVATLEVDALPSLSFQAKDFTVPAGIVEIDYVDQAAGQFHTLAFDQPEFNGFLLQVPKGKNVGKVELQSGKTYTIYCTVPGHRAAGMVANVHVQ